MKGLLLKDLLLHKNYLIFGSIYAIVILGMFQFMNMSGLIMAGTMYGFLLISTVASSDENQAARPVLHSLPVSRDKVMLARYLTIPIIALFSLAVTAFSVLLLSLTGLPQLKAQISPAEAVLIPSVTLFLGAVYLPLHYKFGQAVTRWILLFVFMGVFTMPFVTRGIKINNFQVPSDSAKIAEYYRTPEANWIAAGGAAASAALFIGSFFIARAVYRKREF